MCQGSGMEQTPVTSVGRCDQPGLRGVRCSMLGEAVVGSAGGDAGAATPSHGLQVSHHLQPHRHRRQTVPVSPWASGSASSRSLASVLSSTVRPSTEVRETRNPGHRSSYLVG